MSKLGELRGTVTVAFEGVAGEAVATFAVPIAVLDQVRDGDVHAVALGTPEVAIRGQIADAFTQALDLALAGIPTARVEYASGGVLPSGQPRLPMPMPGPHLYPPRSTEPARRAIDRFRSRDASRG